jgi:hypothetical protein
MATQFKNILEKTSRKYSAIIKDMDNIAVPAASLTTMVLTLYSIHSLAVINSRNAQNVLNANNVSIDANGVLIWEMQPADNVVLDTTLQVEVHRAKFEWTWGGGKAGRHEVDFQVRNLNKVI